jgi:di/tricarboxylate transporter
MEIFWVLCFAACFLIGSFKSDVLVRIDWTLTTLFVALILISTQLGQIIVLLSKSTRP